MPLPWKSIKATSYYCPLRTNPLEAIEDEATGPGAEIEKHYVYSLRTYRLSICFVTVASLVPLSDGYCERKMWAWSALHLIPILPIEFLIGF